MKRTFGLLLFLVMFLLFSQETHATTTILLGRSVEGDGEFFYDGMYESGNIEGRLISLAYIKKIKIVITNQFGEFYNGYEKNHMESLDIQVGYPLYSDNKGLLYLTMTGMKYSGYDNYYLETHEADGGLIGFEIIGTPSDKVQFEFGWHKAFDGSYRINDDNLSLELLLLKFKIQYLLTDNLGLVIYWETKDFNNNDAFTKRLETIDNTVIGFIYRL